MKKSIKLKLIIYVAVVFVALLATLLCTSLFKKANAFVMPSEIWETFDIELSDLDSYKGSIYNNDSKGLKITGTYNSYATLKNEQSGDFHISLLSFCEDERKDQNVAIRIKNYNNSEEYFDIIFDASKVSNNIRVQIDGCQYGVYNELNNTQSSLSLLGITKYKNSQGDYTKVNIKSSLELFFEPRTMCIYAGDGDKTFLVWDFSCESNDGCYCGKVFDCFEKYTVSIHYPSAKLGDKVSTLVYKINGLNFGNKTLGNEEVKLNVFPNIIGKVNREYRIPTPYKTSVYITNKEKIFVEVKKNNSIILNKTEYIDDLTFIPKEAGEYVIKYSCSDIEIEKTIIVKNNLNENITIFGEYKSYYTLGEVVKILPCNITSEANLNNRQIDVLTTVIREGIPVDGFIKLDGSAYYSYTLLEKGNYSIKYESKDDYGISPKVINFSVGDDGACFSIAEINDAILGDELQIPDCYATILGEKVSAVSKIIFPSGKCFSNKNIILNESGVYTIVYTAKQDNKTYENLVTFNVYSNVTDIVVADKADVYYGESLYSDEIKGLVVESENSGTITFKDTVDFTNKTKDDLLLELMVEPSNYGEADFSELEIRFTDFTNENNYVSVILYSPSDSRSYVGTACTVVAKVCGKESKAYRFNINDSGTEGWKEVVDGTRDIGYVYPMSFKGTTYFQSFEKQTFKLYFDYEEKAVYLGTPWIALWSSYWKNQFSEDKIAKLIDFDEESNFVDLWNGFANGKALVSITANSLSKTRAKYIVSQFNGVSLTEKQIVDKNTPILNIDVDTIPLAVVGKEYKLFDAYAYDDNSGMCSVSTKVYYYDSNVEMDIVDGVFVPYYTGDYRIVYSAKDAFGNSTEKIVWVKAKNQLEIEPLYITLSGEYTLSCFVGEKVQFAKPDINGGTGSNYSYEIKVLYNNNELNVDINNFIPKQAGIYTIKYIVYDYVGNSAYTTYELQASYSSTPILLDEISYAPYYVVGREYNLNKNKALLYKADSSIEIEPLIKVSYDGGLNYQEINGGVFIPTQEGIVKIKYSYDYIGFSSLIKEFDVNIVKIDQSNFDITDYFAVESAIKSADSFGTIITSQSENAKASFVKELYSGVFTISLKTADDSTIKKFSIVLQDALNGKTIKFTVSGETKGILCNAILNNTKQVKIKSVLGGQNILSLKYVNSEKSFYLGDGRRLFIANTDEQGNSFAGFSEFIYCSIIIEEASEGDTLTIMSISEQSLVANNGDYGMPKIVYSGEFGRRFKIGETIILPKAKGFDVLSDVESVILTVQGASLTNVPADKEYQVSFSKEGKYAIAYTCTDSSDNTFIDRYIITVVDDKSFNFSLNNEIVESIAKGGNIAVPEITVSDDRSVTIQVFAILPNGLTERVEGEFRFNEIGEYTLRYFVYDKNYNYVIKDYKIRVK